MPDNQINITKLKAKDPATLRRVFNDNLNLVYNIVLKLSINKNAVDDTVHDIFLKVYSKLHTYKGTSKLSTWIYRIAYNHCLDMIRKDKKCIVNNSQTLEEWKDEASKELQPEKNYTKKEENELLYNFISKLPLKYKAVLEMFYFKSLSYRDIAEIMEMPEGTVKTYLYRSKEQLRALYMEMEKKYERVHHN